ncbi:hypothetical protein LSAT2_014406 [Lamellibrachia satsuma]|nr:hypothetical protein LSAT2_014406 [Lamellibrachia satsuma]
MLSLFVVLSVVSGLKCFRGNDGKRSCYKATTYCLNIGKGADLVFIESQTRDKLSRFCHNRVTSEMWFIPHVRQENVWRMAMDCNRPAI